jgi:hypothetical protein
MAPAREAGHIALALHADQEAAMTEVLYAPNRERLVATNAWAFLHWLRVVRNLDLPAWQALQRWSADDPAAFASAIADFARLADAPLHLVRHGGGQEVIVWRGAQNARVALTRDNYAASLASLPPEIASVLTRRWPAEALIRPLAELLLHADLRPDDRVLVVGAAWPWLAALLEGTTIILAGRAGLLAAAERECATVLVAAPRVLSEAAFQRLGRRAGLARLRTVIAAGGPLSPEARRRIYAWMKADVMLLARTGDVFWGNPLEPVLAQPPATPAFLTPPASIPATP